MTIVPEDALKTDPQILLYHSPSLPPVKFQRLTTSYHFWRAVDAAEQAAATFGRLLVPASCLHWQRKQRLEDRRVKIGKQAYFCLSPKEMTGIEREKYQEIAREGDESCPLVEQETM